MVKEFSKPVEARQVEARSRAKACGVRVTVVVEAHKYSTRSQSEPGVTYTVERTRAGWGCDCQGFTFTGMCKHVAQVQRRSEREGWSFGTIAPRLAA